MTIFRLRLRFFSLNVEKIKVKRSILFQISYFRKSVVKKLRVVIILFRADKIDQFRHIKVSLRK